MDEQSTVAGSGISFLSKVKTSWMEGMFYFVLAVTVVHAGYILWDLLTMVPAFAQAAGPGAPNTRTASPEMSTLYLALLGIYGGCKEFRRWSGAEAPAGVLEQAQRFSRGSVIVYCWLGLLVLSIAAKDAQLIPRLPNELFRTAMQALAIWAGTSTSRELFKKRAKGAGKKEGEATEPGARLGAEHREKVLEYLKSNLTITGRACQELTGLDRYQVNRLFDGLEEDGSVVGEGTGKGRRYRLAEGKRPPEQPAAGA